MQKEGERIPGTEQEPIEMTPQVKEVVKDDKFSSVPTCATEVTGYLCHVSPQGVATRQISAVT